MADSISVDDAIQGILDAAALLPPKPRGPYPNQGVVILRGVAYYMDLDRLAAAERLRGGSRDG
jgi:hypothetical protein